MFEIDKGKFGLFIAQLRKEKGLTQKEVAERLFISDKAVSKWERAQSLPDITLLVPLAAVLGVTVTELLEGQRISQQQVMPKQQVETLVQKAIHFSDEEPKSGVLSWQYLPVLAVSVLAAALEVILLLYLGQLANGVLLMELLWTVFGVYFCFFAPRRLPAYYDENRISAYSHGPFRMNLPGVSFNNGNWPHIVGFCRFWCLAALVLYPLLTVVHSWLLETLSYGVAVYTAIHSVALLLILSSLFVPLYVLARKYE